MEFFAASVLKREFVPMFLKVMLIRPSAPLACGEMNLI
jgi:hypothetical protein